MKKIHYHGIVMGIPLLYMLGVHPFIETCWATINYGYWNCPNELLYHSWFLAFIILGWFFLGFLDDFLTGGLHTRK